MTTQKINVYCKKCKKENGGVLVYQYSTSKIVHVQVACNNKCCDYVTKWHKDEDDAIENWNNTLKEDALEEEIDDLNRELSYANEDY